MLMSSRSFMSGESLLKVSLCHGVRTTIPLASLLPICFTVSDHKGAQQRTALGQPFSASIFTLVWTSVLGEAPTEPL